MSRKWVAFGLALFALAAASVVASACDVAFLGGDSGELVSFPSGRNSRRVRHYVALSSTNKCAGIITGWSSCLDDKHIVVRSSSNGEFPGGASGEVQGYLISCPSSCARHLATRSEIVGHLTGSKEFSGYIAKGGAEAIRAFLVGCPNSVLRGFLVSHRSSPMTKKMAKTFSNSAYHIVTRSSYLRRFTAGRTARATRCFAGGGPSRALTHHLVNPRTNVRKHVASAPSSACPGYLGGPSSRVCPEYVADTQCED